MMYKKYPESQEVPAANNKVVDLIDNHYYVSYRESTLTVML